MALALVLRNSSKIPVSVLQKNFLKNVCLASTTRDFSLKSQSGSQLSLNAPNSSISQVRLMSGDHSKLWPIEKGISLGLVAIVPAAVLFPNFILDNLAAVASVIHFHWGLEACVVDYVRPIIFGNVIPKLALGLLYLVSIGTLGGLIYFNVNDIGIGKTIRRFWTIKQ